MGRYGYLNCAVALVILTIMGWLEPLNVMGEESICARVKIEIRQELTLERQAFDANMRITNGLTHVSLEDVNIDVSFADEDGNPVLASSDPNNTDALFFIRIDSMSGLDDIDGAGIVIPDSVADIHWLIIPAQGASNGLEQGTLYYVGAKLSYTIGGEEHVTEVSPDYIFVKPMPDLVLDYFLPNDVYGDDPFTSEIEEEIPFSFGVRVSNTGKGVARSLKIDSAQPKIVENEQGLLINFQIRGSEVNGAAATPSLLVNFGNIDPNEAGTARWIMTCSLYGKFVEFTAEFTHADELGGELTSLISAVNTHFLVHDVRVDLPGRDAIRDFLALDGAGYRVYESNNVDSAVADRSASAGMVQSGTNGTQILYTLTVPVTDGLMVVKLDDPLAGSKVIKSAYRSDGKQISLDNVWLFKTRVKNNPWQHYFYLFDVNTPGRYTIVFEDPSVLPRAPVLQFIPDRQRVEGQQVSFIVEASDPNGTIPTLSTSPLPVGATFVDNGNGTGLLDWTPTIGQAGTYPVKFMASDGVLKDSQIATVTICTAGDTDYDGMDDQWELDHFGTLDRDGSGDFDGDGVSDRDEYLNGTDPTTVYLSLDVALSTGYNLVTYPVDVQEDSNTARKWMVLIGNGSEIEAIERFNVVTGAMEVVSHENDADFPIQSGLSYVLRMKVPKRIRMEGECHRADLELSQGVNFAGYPCPFPSISAYGWLQAIGRANVASIQRFNTTTGAFESCGFCGDGATTDQPCGVDFPIIKGEGYMINMKNGAVVKCSE
ncbi:MAG: Ig domain-containing protein [Pseudomonadota bacterium]